ncbi:HK97 family phage prohead protease [uncultured Clostridium sp.]|uniref:HK97 family phage prohead protease n=1 Tax=uncultured Clostridium sp. TaxID=59620 RepID=UPI002731C6D0|nr:HK97 family phage prohead protease [uncultured Clostridium sp.]
MTNKLEFRENYELRAVDSEEGKMVIEGVVNQVGEWSKVLYGSFREKIEPKVFERAIKSAKDNNRDIFFLALHNNRELPLASIISGTMELVEKENKLMLRAELPPTTLAKDIYELVKAKVLREFSFGFNNVQAKWDKDADGIRTRTITNLTLHEVSIVTTGAYNNTVANARSMDLSEILPKEDDEKRTNQNDDEVLFLYNKNKLKLLNLGGA